MAVTSVSVQTISMSAADPNDMGVNPIVWTTVDSSNGNRFTSTDKEVVLFRRTDAGEAIVTFDSIPCDQGFSAAHDLVMHIQAGNVTEQFVIIGRYAKSHWAQTLDTVTNQVKITYSGTVTNTKIAVIRYV